MIKERQKKQFDIKLTYLDIPVCTNIQIYRCTAINSNSLPDKHHFLSTSGHSQCTDSSVYNKPIIEFTHTQFDWSRAMLSFNV